MTVVIYDTPNDLGPPPTKISQLDVTSYSVFFFGGGDILGKIFSFLLLQAYIKKRWQKEYNLKNVPFNIPPPMYTLV